jgi:hypothetical protein
LEGRPKSLHRFSNHVFGDSAVKPELFRVTRGSDVHAEALIDLAAMPKRELGTAAACVENNGRAGSKAERRGRRDICQRASSSPETTSI